MEPEKIHDKIEDIIDKTLEERELIRFKLKEIAELYFKNDQYNKNIESIINFIDELAFRKYIILNKDELLNKKTLPN